ncbi:hypothetical protein PAGU2638_02130 [Lysobacter sp. PAGU 2638]
MKRFSRNEVAKNDPRHEAHARKAEACMRTPSSFIRTVTVGSGVRPDLLTLRIAKALAGSRVSRLPPVGSSAPP